jgi:hypothetical protein
LAGSADLSWDDSTNVLGVGGDINLDDGGTYKTTLQIVTPATADRTITFPDATGTVGLVAGSSGQAIYNDAGAYSGLSTVTTDGTDVTLTGRFIGSLNGALSATGIAGVPAALTGTWIATGGTATTTKPQFLIEPAGTTSTAWSTAGTGLGINATSGFTGRLLDLQVNGTSRVIADGAGRLLVGTSSTSAAMSAIFQGNSGNTSGLSDVFLASGTDSPGTAGQLGRLSFSDSGHTATVRIVAQRDGGTWTSGSSLPSALVFSVTANGSASPTEALRISSNRAITVSDGGNVVLGTTTGTKIGTATTQKLGFFNATPVVQPTAVADSVDTTDIVAQFNALLSRMRDLGLIAT